MTTPPAPPAPPQPPPAPPQPPPAPPQPPPAPANGPPAPDQPGPEALAALAAERQRVRDLEAELRQLREQGMSDAEKAVAKAKEEGRAEAAHEAALRLAAAEFRAQAAGRLADPEAALAVLDLGKLLKDNEPDKKAIGKLVEQLAVVPPAPGHIPTGPRPGTDPGDTDWLRNVRRSR
jgi:hypothetical protein